MTIYRRIFRVRIAGSRTTGDLRPAFAERIRDEHRGVNLRALEYNEEEGWCVVECWCSDHPILSPEERKTQADLERIDMDPDVIEVLKSHSRSPVKLASIAVSPGSLTLDRVDEEAKTIILSGREVKFLRRERIHDTAGREVDLYILDEG